MLYAQNLVGNTWTENPVQKRTLGPYIPFVGEILDAKGNPTGQDAYAPQNGGRIIDIPSNYGPAAGLPVGGASFGAGSMPAPSQSATSSSGATFGGAATPSQSNAAMVNALRQKPARYAGLGMGLGTNASMPQPSNTQLSNVGTSAAFGGSPMVGAGGLFSTKQSR